MKEFKEEKNRANKFKNSLKTPKSRQIIISSDKEIRVKANKHTK